MATWKRVVLIAAGFGAGFAICAALIVGAFYWNSQRPKPWNKNALTAKFATMEFTMQPEGAAYKVDFQYDVQNGTAKEFGHYQAEDPKLDGPAFIPAHGKARIHVLLAYGYSSDWTSKEKGDIHKVIEAFNHRLRELNGFVAYDQTNHYEIDMPEGWRNWDDVKKAKD